MNMSLNQALRILAAVHTRDDHLCGFVTMGASPQNMSVCSDSEYREAWRVVREHVRMQSELPTAF